MSLSGASGHTDVAVQFYREVHVMSRVAWTLTDNEQATPGGLSL